MSTKDDVQERQSLLSKLLDAVKQCQIRFGGKTELATENDSRVVCLCAQLEAVLQHGLKRKSFLPLRHVPGMMKGLINEPEPVFWQAVRVVLTRHELERFLLLRNIQSEAGRGRAWLRSALNERSLERYMHTLVADPQHLKTFYEDWAFLLDQERSSMLPMMAAGLGSILFAISIDNPDLNQLCVRPAPVECSPQAPVIDEPKPVICSKPSKKKKKKKRPTSQIISFDDEDLSNENAILIAPCSVSCSAPPTCLSSPVQPSPDFASFDETGFSATLTPVGNAASVGELIPIQSEDTLATSEVSSFNEDVESAVAALAVAQRPASWSLRSRADTLNMAPEELREALLSVMQKRDEFEDKNNALRCLLEREMELGAALRAELEEQRKSQEERFDRVEQKAQTLARENELLKHQLKKYIAAVQMLKHDSSKVQELSSIVGDIQPPIPEAKVFIDHQFEASEYEKKLVQVAEMHGELMEFNERLHLQLLGREALIRRLREELVDLRGPLPDDNQTSDDDLSITSDYDASLLRPLINVWIPSAFLTGRTADVHHVYQVYVRIRDDEWNVYRRYAQFYALHKTLRKKDPVCNTFDFPPKKTIGKKDARVVEARRRRLQHYLRCVLNWLMQQTDVCPTDKESFVNAMPFFSDQQQPKSAPPPPHYTGL